MANLSTSSIDCRFFSETTSSSFFTSVRAIQLNVWLMRGTLQMGYRHWNHKFSLKSTKANSNNSLALSLGVEMPTRLKVNSCLWKLLEYLLYIYSCTTSATKTKQKVTVQRLVRIWWKLLPQRPLHWVCSRGQLLASCMAFWRIQGRWWDMKELCNWFDAQIRIALEHWLPRSA